MNAPFPASAPPMSAVPYGQWTPGQAWPVIVAPPRPTGRSRWQLIASLVAVAAIVASAVVFVAFLPGSSGSAATWVKGKGLGDPPPGAFDSDAKWTDWARREVSLAVEAQGKALLSGDEKGYLAFVDPDNARLLGDLTRRYEALHAMVPGVWNQSISGAFAASGNHKWTVKIRTTYCFGPPTCATVRLMAGSEWAVKDNRVVLIKLDATDSRWNGPRPWETDALTIRNGDRVVMGASKSGAWRLPDAVRYADNAAKVADQFAKWEDPPSKYVIFFAGPSEWNKWYGDEQPQWAAAWAVPVSSVVTEVVVRSEGVRQVDLEFILTHEFTHVTSLAGKRDGADSSAWWLIEGIADYAAMLKFKVSEYDALVPTRSFVRNRWNGDPAVARPTAAASDADAAARYGVAFLAVRAIAQKYGQAKMLDFFGRVVHDDEAIDAASRAALGASWSVVKKYCASFIRTSVG